MLWMTVIFFVGAIYPDLIGTFLLSKRLLSKRPSPRRYCAIRCTLGVGRRTRCRAP